MGHDVRIEVRRVELQSRGEQAASEQVQKRSRVIFFMETFFQITVDGGERPAANLIQWKWMRYHQAFRC
jgi:hypothetical protein